MTLASTPVATSEEGRKLEVSWTAPQGIVMRAFRMSRDELLKSMVDGNLPNPPIGQLLNFRVAEAEPGRAVIELIPDERHENAIGVVAGGVVGTVLDAAMWIAVQASLEDKSVVNTVSMSLNFIRKLSRDTGTVRAVAQTLHVGRSIATAESWLEDETGRRYAQATASFLRMGGPQ